MGVRIGSVVSTTIVNAILVTTAETVVAISPPLSLAVDNATVLLFAIARVTTGTTTNSLNGFIRRGTTTAAPAVSVAGASSVSPTGSVTSVACICWDIPGVVAGQQYAFTVTQGAATANGTVTEVQMIAMVL